MSDSEILAAYHRDNAELKKQKLAMLALRSELEMYAGELTDLSRRVTSFAAYLGATTTIESLKEGLRRVGEKCHLIDELEDTAGRVRLLESRVAEFKANLE